MPNKKTSQEASGYPIQGTDEFRIARSGDNKKLTSYDIFSETVTKATFVSMVASSSLIPGRWYRVSGLGANNTYPTSGAVQVQATKVNKVSSRAIVEISANDHFICGYDYAADQINYVVDSKGNTIYNYFDATAANRFPINTLGSNNHVYQNIASCVTGNLTNTTISNSTIKGLLSISGVSLNNVVIDGILGANTVAGIAGSAGSNSTIKNTELKHAVLNITSASTVVIENCSFENCTVYVTGTTTLKNIKIRGGIDPATGNRVAYYFDNETITSGGEVVFGKYSTLSKDLDLSDGYVYSFGSQLLYLNPFTYWVGQFNLTNPPVNPVDIKYIQFTSTPGQTHTPFKLVNNSSSDINLSLDHIPSGLPSNPWSILADSVLYAFFTTTFILRNNTYLSTNDREDYVTLKAGYVDSNREWYIIDWKSFLF